jgi:hypothetical protein
MIAILIVLAAAFLYLIATVAGRAARWRESDEGRAWAAARRLRRRHPTRRQPSHIDLLESRLDARIDAMNRRIDRHVDCHAG